jgi:hypothetical protein
LSGFLKLETPYCDRFEPGQHSLEVFAVFVFAVAREESTGHLQQV